MTEEELEKKAEDNVFEQLGFDRDFIEQELKKMKNPNNKFMVDALIQETKQAYIAGAKETQKEADVYWQNIITEQHKLVDVCRIKAEEEIEQLKQQVSYLEDNLRVARKDREDLRDAVANGLEEFIKEKPHTSLRFLANKELKEENEHIRRLLGTAIIVLNRIENPEVPYEKAVDNLRKLKELLGSVE